MTPVDSRIKVRIWAHCYKCRRYYPHWMHGRGHMWVWNYEFRCNGLRVYSQSGYKEWSRAAISARAHYPVISRQLLGR